MSRVGTAAIAALMRILLTNDDGVNARGLALLEKVARTLSDDIWIVAVSYTHLTLPTKA